MQMIATDRLFVPLNAVVDKKTGTITSFANGIVVKGQEFAWRGSYEDAPSNATAVDPKDQDLVDEAHAQKAERRAALAEARTVTMPASPEDVRLHAEARAARIASRVGTKAERTSVRVDQDAARQAAEAAKLTAAIEARKAAGQTEADIAAAKAAEADVAKAAAEDAKAAEAERKAAAESAAAGKRGHVKNGA